MNGLGKYSFGTGDRFGMEGRAQLQSILKMKALGVQVTPVWNKSHREHQTVGSEPSSVRDQADDAVQYLKFDEHYFVDADHINLKTVDAFIASSDFFTIDVAGFIGKKGHGERRKDFLLFFKKYTAGFQIPGMEESIEINDRDLQNMADNFLLAMEKAAEIYFHIKTQKQGSFCTEVSIDEVPLPQSPVELFFILAALGFYQVPVTTIAPKFTGRFNKGVDYQGNLRKFESEFEEDILVIKYAIKEFGLPQDLKLSVHSGSDKFAIYPVISRLLEKHRVGLHVKTAGTTWLEEIIGLAQCEGAGFEFALQVYQQALDRYEELTSPYATVLDIDRDCLPTFEFFKKGTGQDLAAAIRHEPDCKSFNPHVRQLMHCAYKIAAENSQQFHQLLKEHRKVVEKNVSYNMLERHLKPLFLAVQAS